MRVRGRQDDVLRCDPVLACDVPSDGFRHYAFDVGDVGGDENADMGVPVAQRDHLDQQRRQGALGISLAAEPSHIRATKGRRDVRLGIADRPRTIRRFVRSH